MTKEPTPGLAAADVFRPLPSMGWLWSLGFAVLSGSGFVIMGVEALDPAAEPTPVWVWAMLVALIVPLVAFFVALAVVFPRMRYELGPHEMVLRYGPLLTYRVPYEDIVGIDRAELKSSIWSSVRWPGLALWGVPYVGEGTIYMCSTRVDSEIVVIETAEKRFGVSPEEADRFVDAVRSRARPEPPKRS